MNDKGLNSKGLEAHVGLEFSRPAAIDSQVELAAEQEHSAESHSRFPQLQKPNSFPDPGAVCILCIHCLGETLDSLNLLYRYVRYIPIQESRPSV